MKMEYAKNTGRGMQTAFPSTLTERRRRAAAAAERAYFGSVKRCANYWQGCFTCNQYLPETVFFCLRANMAVYGVDVPLPGKA